MPQWQAQAAWAVCIDPLSRKTNRIRNFSVVLNGEFEGTENRQRKHLFSLPICVIMIQVMQMDNEKELPKRKRNRLENYDYSSCGAYFITVCTLERQNYFWENVGAIIDRPQDVELSTYGK